MDKRRSLTPNTGIPNVTKRRGGARLTVSDRVTFRGLGDAAGQLREGWALNVSRGGLRVILEESVELGAEFDVTMTGSALGDDDGVPRVGRIVWVQEEPDGVVAGIEFR